MAGKTHYYSDEVLGVLDNTFTPPTPPFHVALFTVAPDDDYTGAATTGTEANYGAQARKVVAAVDWAAAIDGPSVGRRRATNTAISWPAWDGGSQTINAAAIMEDLTVGEMLYWATITPRSINDTETFQFDSGNLIVQED